jgi:ribonuclease D
VEYAAADVWYLLPIAGQLMAETEALAGCLRRWTSVV